MDIINSNSHIIKLDSITEICYEISRVYTKATAIAWMKPWKDLDPDNKDDMMVKDYFKGIVLLIIKKHSISDDIAVSLFNIIKRKTRYVVDFDVPVKYFPLAYTITDFINTLVVDDYIDKEEVNLK